MDTHNHRAQPCTSETHLYRSIDGKILPAEEVLDLVCCLRHDLLGNANASSVNGKQAIGDIRVILVTRFSNGQNISSARGSTIILSPGLDQDLQLQERDC